MYLKPGPLGEPWGQQMKRRPAVEWESREEAGQGKKAEGLMHPHRLLVQVGALRG